MQIRDSLNSRVLQDRFPDRYKEIFSKCQLVVSSPHFFTWAGEYVGYFGGTMLLQKLPFRLYVGFETISNESRGEKIVLADDLFSYSLAENKFQKDQLEHSAEERLVDFLNNYYFKEKGRSSLKAHLLSEMPFGGSGSSGALCSALALALSCLLQKNKKEPDTDKVFRLAWKMLSAYRGRQVSGATVFNCLTGSAGPIFYKLKEPLAEDLKIDRALFEAGELKDLFKIKEGASWPIDFGLLYLGEPRGAIAFSVYQLKDETAEVARFFKKKNFWQSTLKVMDFLSSHVVLKAGQLLKQGGREDTLRGFLSAVNKHQVLFRLLGFVPDSIDYLSSLIRFEARKVDELGAALKSVSTSKKDVLLFVMSFNKAKEVLTSALPKLKKELASQVYLGYASWLDGLEQEPVKVEQFLTNKIYSQFIGKKSILLREFNSNQQLQSLILSEEVFNKRKKTIDLVIEAGKIYLRGKKLTSKELPSSKTTAQVLKLVLESKGEAISNQALPRSSYSQDRYELQSKITSPLLKFFKARTGKPLPLQVKGGITDFILKLSPGNYIIWLAQE